MDLSAVGYCSEDHVKIPLEQNMMKNFPVRPKPVRTIVKVLLCGVKAMDKQKVPQMIMLGGIVFLRPKRLIDHSRMKLEGKSVRLRVIKSVYRLPPRLFAARRIP